MNNQAASILMIIRLLMNYDLSSKPSLYPNYLMKLAKWFLKYKT